MKKRGQLQGEIERENTEKSWKKERLRCEGGNEGKGG